MLKDVKVKGGEKEKVKKQRKSEADKEGAD